MVDYHRNELVILYDKILFILKKLFCFFKANIEQRELNYRLQLFPIFHAIENIKVYYFYDLSSQLFQILKNF